MEILGSRTMLVKKIFSGKSMAGGIKAFGVLFLLLSYFAGNNRPEAFHKLLHAHEKAVSHSAEQEEDPCHRAVYHNEKNACGHSSHFATKDKCDLCHLLSCSDQVAFSRSFPDHTQWQPANAEHIATVQLLVTQVRLPSRAPPLS